MRYLYVYKKERSTLEGRPFSRRINYWKQRRCGLYFINLLYKS